MGMGWGGAGRVRSKNSKPIPVLPHGAGLKSCSITFAGQGKPVWGEAGKSGLSEAGQGKIIIPMKKA